MKLYCPYCQHPLAVDHRVCPRCKGPVTDTQKQRETNKGVKKNG